MNIEEKRDAALRDGHGPVVREAMLRDVNVDRREARFIFSTDSVDRWGTRILQNWRLENFRRNPVVLYAHNSRDLPIGQVTELDVRDGKLQGTIRFASEKANPNAELVWQSIREGTLRATSVGFWPHAYRWEKEDDVEVLIFDDNELLEQSIVPIPGNAEAVMQHFRALATGRANVSPARAGSQEIDMDLKETQAALEKANQDLGAARADRDAQKTRADAAEERATKAETRATALDAQNKTLVTERDAAKASLVKLEDGEHERAVDAIVGKKILPAERDAMLKVRKSDRALFDELVAQRSDLTVLVRDPAGMGSDKLTQRANDEADHNGFSGPDLLPVA